MKEEYMSDEELLELINEVETGAMLKAPVYLKGQILQAIEKEEEEKSRGHSVRQSTGKSKKNIRKQLLVYKLEVIGTLAAAIVMLFLIPVSIPNRPNTTDSDIREQRTSIFDYWNTASSQLLQHADAFSNQLLHPLDTFKKKSGEEPLQQQIQE